MTTAELKNAVRDAAVNQLLHTGADSWKVSVEKPFTFLVPVTIDNVTYYAQVGVTCKTVADTKTSARFVPDPAEWTNALEGVRASRLARPIK